ncbi:MAG: hypothetical protein HYV61_02565 [Candidatus Rokubacteria bacterium]|nr:hypothetical protein [Candidatus Rokubacteria bacterium]
MAQRRKAHGTAADVPESMRREVLKRANELLSRKFEPRVPLERRRRHAFNYPIEVFAEGRGRYFYLCTRYRTPGGRPADDFVVRSTRLEYTDLGRFNLAYFRHTNRWWTVYAGLSLSECFETIESEELFWPVL